MRERSQRLKAGTLKSRQAESAGQEAAMRRLVARMRRCAKCGRKGPPVFGRFEPGQRWMLVGQAPGKEEVRRGMPFVGPAGRKLFDWLKRAGFEEEEFRSECYVTAVHKCYPGSTGHGDLRPSRHQLESCSRFVDEELAIVKPEVLILVGSLAIEHFLGKLRLADAVGRQFKRTLSGLAVMVIPLPHPSGVSVWPFRPENQRLLTRALGLIARAASAQ